MPSYHEFHEQSFSHIDHIHVWLQKKIIVLWFPQRAFHKTFCKKKLTLSLFVQHISQMCTEREEKKKSSNGLTNAALIEVYYSNCIMRAIRSSGIFKSCINFKCYEACYEYFNFGLQALKCKNLMNAIRRDMAFSTEHKRSICQWISILRWKHSSIFSHKLWEECERWKQQRGTIDFQWKERKSSKSINIRVHTEIKR